MLQAVLVQPQQVEIREVEKLSPGHNQVLIAIQKIGICGSDIHAYYGEHPYISCPIVQGHEFAGEIIELGKGVTEFQLGDKVTVMPQIVCGTCYSCSQGNYHICNSLKVIGCQVEGAAQQYFIVDKELVMKLPEGLSYDDGAMIEPLAVGVHAVRRLGDIRGKDLVVLGAGPIGNLTAQAAKGLGAKSVIITDMSDHKLGIARQTSIDYAINTAKEDLRQAIQVHFGDKGADAILECVGVQATIEQAISVSRKGSDIIVVGVYGKKPTVDIGLVQDKELRLIGTLMYKKEDYESAIQLIQTGKVVLKPLISKHFPFREYGDAYKYIEQNRDTTLKVMINVKE